LIQKIVSVDTRIVSDMYKLFLALTDTILCVSIDTNVCIN
jgi:hypothetical protein